MTDKPSWEGLHDLNNNMRTWRMRVSGGYIYRMMHFNNSHTMFVPDLKNDHYSELIKRIEKLEKSTRFDDKSIDENFIRVSDFCRNIDKRVEKLECNHDFGNTMLLSDPPKMQCIKCGYIICLPKMIHTTTETLSLCLHGRPIKFNDCARCNQTDITKI